MSTSYLAKYEIHPLFTGFPARSDRGFLGWSSALLIQIIGELRSFNILFDTAGYNERETLLQRLSEHQLKLEDIDGVILSHLHFDHAVNWMMFPRADLYIHKLELFPEQQYEDFAIPDFHREKLIRHPRIHHVEEGSTINGMEVLHAPGHTPGQIAMKIGKTILASDAVKNRMELHDGTLMNTWNEKAARESIQKIKRHADVIFPGHDVPLVKEGSGWKAKEQATITLSLASGLQDTNDNDSIPIQLSD